MKKPKRNSVPGPSVSRLCHIYSLLEDAVDQGVTFLSSREIGEKLGISPHNVRKDINCLGEIGTSGSGYETSRLKAHIGEWLGFNLGRKACVAGLGNLGVSLLNSESFLAHQYTIVAGFDSSVNRLETITTGVPLFPAREIAAVVRRMGVELAVLTVPAREVRETAERLCEGGVRGIVNFSPAVLAAPKGVFVRNIDLVGEFRYLTALMELGKG
jgi:redox-sensing transcriptional repressor